MGYGMHFFNWTWLHKEREIHKDRVNETVAKKEKKKRKQQLRSHLAAGERQSPLPVWAATQWGAARQQVEARYGLLLCDFTIPEVVGCQPALGHSRPAPKRHHRQQVVQHPAGSGLEREIEGADDRLSPKGGERLLSNPLSTGGNSLSPVPGGRWWWGVHSSPVALGWECLSGGCASAPPQPRWPPPRTSPSPGWERSSIRPETEGSPGMGWSFCLHKRKVEEDIQ